VWHSGWLTGAVSATRPMGRDASGSPDTNWCLSVSPCFYAAELYKGGKSVSISAWLAPLHSEV
jgi:hypothetical protein